MAKKSWTKKNRLVTGHQAGCDIVTFHTRSGKAVKVVRCRKRVGGIARAAKRRFKEGPDSGKRVCLRGKVGHKKFTTRCG